MGIDLLLVYKCGLELAASLFHRVIRFAGTLVALFIVLLARDELAALVMCGNSFLPVDPRS